MSKELIIALTGGIGVNFDKVVNLLKYHLHKSNVNCREIRLSRLIDDLINGRSNGKNEIERIEFYMDKISKLRKKTNKNSLMALLAILDIFNKRNESESKYTAYILSSLKRPEEADLLRHIYGRNFILISVHTSKAIRFRQLSDNETEEEGRNINELIEKDAKETDENLYEHGQNVIGTYPNAHVFVDTENDLDKSLERFVDIIFGYPYHTPTIEERNMFAAKGISLRSADLSRQVGAIIADKDGNIVASGCNDVPKFGGGLYEPDDINDGRDFKLGKDTNVDEKKQIIDDFIKKLISLTNKDNKTRFLDELHGDDNIEKTYIQFDDIKSKITDLLEFGRPIHAELAAICDAAKRGVPLKDMTLYCTTFPCHLCIKHILAVGIMKVVYIAPYPKSKAQLHFEDSITDDTNEAGEKLLLHSFIGISPRRFMHVFRYPKGRKYDKINPKKAERNVDSPYLECRYIIDYYAREIMVLHHASKDNRIQKIKNITNLFNISDGGNLQNIIELFEDLSTEYWKNVVK